MLNINDSVLVIIDIQEKLVNAVKGFSPVKNASKLAKVANILDIPVIITEQYPQGLGETISELKNNLPQNSYCFEKVEFSAFKTIKDKLDSLSKKQVIILGIEAHICVYQTICELLDNGYEVYFVKDASASRNSLEFKTSLELIRQNKGQITCTEIVLFEWLKTSTHPKFKEIQSLIK